MNKITINCHENRIRIKTKYKQYSNQFHNTHKENINPLCTRLTFIHSTQKQQKKRQQREMKSIANLRKKKKTDKYSKHICLGQIQI